MLRVTYFWWKLILLFLLTPCKPTYTNMVAYRLKTQSDFARVTLQDLTLMGSHLADPEENGTYN